MNSPTMDWCATLNNSNGGLYTVFYHYSGTEEVVARTEKKEELLVF